MIRICRNGCAGCSLVDGLLSTPSRVDDRHIVYACVPEFGLWEQGNQEDEVKERLLARLREFDENSLKQFVPAEEDRVACDNIVFEEPELELSVQTGARRFVTHFPVTGDAAIELEALGRDAWRAVAIPHIRYAELVNEIEKMLPVPRSTARYLAQHIWFVRNGRHKLPPSHVPLTLRWAMKDISTRIGADSTEICLNMVQHSFTVPFAPDNAEVRRVTVYFRCLRRPRFRVIPIARIEWRRLSKGRTVREKCNISGFGVDADELRPVIHRALVKLICGADPQQLGIPARRWTKGLLATVLVITGICRCRAEALRLLRSVALREQQRAIGQ